MAGENNTEFFIFIHFISETNSFYGFNSCKHGGRHHLDELLFITVSTEHRHFHAPKLHPHLTRYVKPCVRDWVCMNHRSICSQLHWDWSPMTSCSVEALSPPCPVVTLVALVSSSPARAEVPKWVLKLCFSKRAAFSQQVFEEIWCSDQGVHNRY